MNRSRTTTRLWTFFASRMVALVLAGPLLLSLVATTLTAGVWLATPAWAEWPDANIGVATGAISGITVLDVDVKPWKDKQGDVTLKAFIKERGELPATPRQRTWSGGMHHVFAYAPGVRNSVGRLGAGLDVRGDGGYVVVEPSTVEEDERNGTYTWDRLANPFDQPLSPMPEWLLERVESAGAATAARATNGATPDQPSTDFIPEGQRNDTLFRRACAMRRAGFGVEAILAALQDMNERQCRPPLDNHELERIAQQAAGYAPAARGLIIRVDGNSEPLPGELPLSDAGNAGRMVLLYPDRFRWVAEEKVWLSWRTPTLFLWLYREAPWPSRRTDPTHPASSRTKKLAEEAR